MIADDAICKMLVAGLGAAALLATIAFARARAALRAFEAAQRSLARLARDISAGGPGEWRDTGVTEVDSIGRALLEFEQRLRRKRDKLRELNEEIIKKAESHGPLQSSVLRAMIDAMPVGVVLAEAPSGRILEGNRAMETILGHPVIYSDSNQQYGEWGAVYPDGRPMHIAEYPLSRALAGEERPTLECQYRRGDGSVIWISIVGAPIRNDKAEIIGVIAAVTDIEQLKTAEAQRREMNRELHHRVNNSLAMMQGLANITARTARNLTEFRDDFSDRIQCLSRLSTLLVQNSWERVELADAIETAIGHHWREDPGERISVTGESVKIRSEIAVAVGMALCELLSNARQFGALSSPKGTVRLDWRLDNNKVTIRWTEIDGPPVCRPSRTGVGLYLLNNVLCHQLGGPISIAFDPSGLRAEISADISGCGDSPGVRPKTPLTFNN